MATLVVLPAVLFGALIGLYEMILVHRDVAVPQHRFGHGVHAFIFAIAATFISFNVPFVLGLFPALAKIPVLGSLFGIRLAVALIMAIKIHGVSAALKSSSMSTAGLGETWTHSLVIGLLSGFSPYLYPFIAPVLPKWLK
ncbi:hypothetical protein HY492_04085 [Candidatus Woesearchaeota archaeon]|nr:hypothetical protein [Candidatus Woesearchaeota archaeon]